MFDIIVKLQDQWKLNEGRCFRPDWIDHKLNRELSGLGWIALELISLNHLRVGLAGLMASSAQQGWKCQTQPALKKGANQKIEL